VLTFALAVFTAFTSGGLPFGPAVVQQYETGGVRLNSLRNPALAGDALVIWGTGFDDVRDDVVVYMGGVAVKPFYAGPAPDLPGVSQINLFVPRGLTSRCFLPFLVQTPEGDSPVYTLSTNAQRSDCPMEVPLGPEAHAALDRGDTVRVTVIAVQPQYAEAWTGEYDRAHLSVLADQKMWGGAAPVTCSRRIYGYTRFQPPRLSEIYGIRRVPRQFALALQGPGGCAWTLATGEDGVYRASAPNGCPPQTYSIVSGNSSATGSIPLAGPAPEQPSITLEPRADGIEVQWHNPAGVGLTLEFSSSFTLPGNIFSGQTDVRELSCQLSGYSGTGLLRASEIEWALALLDRKPPVIRLSLTSIQGGSWSRPTDGQLLRTTRVFEWPLTLP
jgi:hypothetical protein